MIEFAPPRTEDGIAEETTVVPQKYSYPEFAGWGGERYLKKLLRQILPIALYRTWEIFADHQAQGDDCYLGVMRLAEIAGRTMRTMEKNLAALSARQLLVERAERKLFRRADGTHHTRVVVVKDFHGLYALAHEYHEWLHASTYIAPEREMIALVAQEPHLVAKVRRFDNYRRLLYNRLPGPAASRREEDCWFTDYQPEQPSDAFRMEQGKGVAYPKKDANPTKLLAKDLPKDLAQGSAKRINESSMVHSPERETVDSAVPSFSLSFQDQETNAPESSPQNRPEAGDVAEGRDHAHAHLSASVRVQEPLAEQRRRAQETLPDQEREIPVQNAQPFPGHGEAESNEQGLSGPLLADSFLIAIADPFGDQNPKGTRTRVHTILREASLSHPAEIARCLIRAYLVARNTRSIRSEYCHPATGQANRMPLFCAMVQRLVEKSQQKNESDVLWPQARKEIAADNCLARWWSEYHHLVETPSARVLYAANENPSRRALLPPGSLVNENKPTSLSGQPRASLATPQPAQGSDQYQCYIDALMATYSAPEALQEVH